ncbi:MAG: SGNH/GDSL hydrolase family protein [Flavobacteriaceae bacterium]|jgi:lysophospholipase L1-like esterase|nr:SGNH/GDSL hydrolase family protein [Flavobacteriaceae bacterium]MBT7574768.1 SGNH/GDSL hydrolase family protein [Flavobacteriaceae bacterium]MBT7984266.1 SGNH/GDSL hydrolase family protein [Flavobacteriaceae bacterium]
MKKFLILILLLPIVSFGQTKDLNYSYLALGDSYTIGESVKESERWPVQLSNSLRNKLNKPVIIAKSGWTTDQLIDTLNKINFNKKFDFVSLLIGVNNQYRGRSVENFKQGFTILLKKSIEYANYKKERVMVVSIPDWGVTPFAKNKNRTIIGNEIDAFNKVIHDECMKNNITFFNITEISRKAVNDNSLIAEDGLHPSKKMYKQWVKIIKPYFKNF